jgi:hypothetical protein
LIPNTNINSTVLLLSHTIEEIASHYNIILGRVKCTSKRASHPSQKSLQKRQSKGGSLLERNYSLLSSFSALYSLNYFLASWDPISEGFHLVTCPKSHFLS